MSTFGCLLASCNIFFFLFKIIIHQFKLQNLVLALFYTLLLMMFCAKQGNSYSGCDLCSLNGVHVTTVRSAMDARTPGLLLVQGTFLSFYTHTSKIYIF